MAPRSANRLMIVVGRAGGRRWDACRRLGSMARRRWNARERPPAGVAGAVAELAFDPQQPVVLGDPLRARRRPGLDLARAHRDDEVGDRRVLGLARAMRDDRGPAAPPRQLDRLDRLGQRPDLVELDQDGVRGVGLDRRGRSARCSSRAGRRRRAGPSLRAARVRRRQPAQSSSARPSSIDTIG